jgi:L-histidine N-alpha-methyltransferase
VSDDGRPTDDLRVDVHLTAGDLRAALEDDVRNGLLAEAKSIPPVWFYDEEGSRLFEQITTLPEYYPTRAERQLLERYAPEVAQAAQADTLVELGAGACDKTKVLLDALQGCGSLRRYIPFDVSDDFLRSAAGELVAQYCDLEVHAVVGDFHRHLPEIPTGGRRLVAFLGGTIGNLRPEQRSRFYFDLNCTMAADDHLLLGTDLLKDPARIVAAYDDRAGVTAAFNRNVLSVLNRELDADFDPHGFDHVARWNESEEWIEMRLRCREAATVTLGALNETVDFAGGEDLLTEISAKFTPQGVEKELTAADFVIDGMWGADEGEFLLTLCHPYC